MCRGFYPKGRGEVIYSSSPVQILSPIRMSERGRLVKVEVHCFIAGAVPKKVRLSGSNRSKKTRTNSNSISN